MLTDSGAEAFPRRRRETRPFARRDIRLFATNKSGVEDTSGRPYGRRYVRVKANYLDTVRGCPFSSPTCGDRCPWDCYALESVRRYKILFEEPVSQNFNPKLLARDVRRHRGDWVRIGVFGEPSCDWPLTARVARFLSDMGKRVVIVSRLWEPPHQQGVLRDLEKAQPLIHLTVSALDRDAFLKRRLEFARSPPSGVAVALRLVSFAFRDRYWLKRQEALADWGGLVLEQPARLLTTNPVWRMLDGERMRRCVSYLSRRETGRWYSAGPILGKPCCEGLCSTCGVQCLSSAAGSRSQATLTGIGEFQNTL